MSYSRRIVGLIIASVLLTLIPNAAHISFAQDAKPIIISGSGIMSPVLKSDAESFKAKNASATVQVNVSGSDGGIAALCKGQADIAMANRAIKDPELADCTAGKVNYVELVLGYDALTVIVNPQNPVDCITISQLPSLIGASAKGINNWSSVTAVFATPVAGQTAPTPVVQPMSGVFAAFDPAQADKSQVRVLASTVIGGNDLRADLQPLGDASQVVNKVKSDPTAVGLLTLSDFNNNAGTAVKAVKLNGAVGCVDTSSAANLQELRYPALEVLYLYVNAASLDRADVNDYLTTVLGQDGQANIITDGFVPADASFLARDTTYVKNKQVGRTFSLIQGALVSPDTTGTINIDGSPAIYPILTGFKGTFTSQYKNVTVNLNPIGNDSGISKLCATTTDIIGVTRPMTDVESAVCTKANIKTYQLPLGSDASVIVVNSKNTFASCLTFDQITKIFGIDSDSKVMKWSDVKSDYPGTDLLITSPSDGSPVTDFILSTADHNKPISPLPRLDMSQNDDVNFRAAATAHYDGGITYMRYADYVKLKQPGVYAVAIDGGSGCIKPTDATITDGSYKLSQSLTLIFNVNLFTRSDLKAFVWGLLSDNTVTLLGQSGLIGIDSAKFSAARDLALTVFNQPPTAPVTFATEVATGVATLSAPPTAIGPATMAASAVASPAATAAP